MKYLILLFLLFISWLVSASYSKASSRQWKPTLLANSIFNIFPSSNRDNPFRDISLPSAIRQELYDSIYTGMSYAEVRAIIGWDGISIYDREIDTTEGKIRERVYEWDCEDVDDSICRHQNTNTPRLYWSVTLRFQNDILIEKSSLNLPP